MKTSKYKTLFLLTLLILSTVRAVKKAAEKTELKRQQKENKLNEEVEKILDSLIKDHGVIEFTQYENFPNPEKSEIPIPEEIPTETINKTTTLSEKFKNLFSCFSPVEKPEKKNFRVPFPQPERRLKVSELELKSEIIENKNYQVKFDKEIQKKKIKIPFPIINKYEISVISTKQGKKELYNQVYKKQKRPFPGIAITLDYYNLLKIKNYILPTIIDLFNNIEFSINYQTSYLLIDKITTTIPLPKVPNLLNHINLEFNASEQAVDLVIKKVPLVVRMKVKVQTEASRVFDEGEVFVVGVIDVLKAVVHFREDEEYLFKPVVNVQLSHWELDRGKFKFRTDMRHVSNYLLGKVIGHFKKKILVILKDYIKYSLPMQMTPMLNEYIQEFYQDFYYFGNLGINLLWTNVPFITDDTITIYVSGDVFEKDKYNDVQIFSFDELPVPGSMDTFNTEFSMRRDFINKLLFTYLKDRKQENFEVPAININWQVELIYDEIFVEVIDRKIELHNIHFKFFKTYYLEISCSGFITIHINTENINLKTGKITLNIDSVHKSIKTNKLGLLKSGINQIFDQISKKLIPSEITIPPFKLPMGLTMGDITFSNSDSNLHLGSVLDINELLREKLVEPDETSGDFGENLVISSEEDEEEDLDRVEKMGGRMGFGLQDMMIDDINDMTDLAEEGIIGGYKINVNNLGTKNFRVII